jgi:DNA-binding XRE family transcriptional regulator
MTKLRKFIYKNNINQSEIARQLDVTRYTMNNWVRGKNCPPVPMAIRLCGLLGVTVEEMFDDLLVNTRKAKSIKLK